LGGIAPVDDVAESVVRSRPSVDRSARIVSPWPRVTEALVPEAPPPACFASLGTAIHVNMRPWRQGSTHGLLRRHRKRERGLAWTQRRAEPERLGSRDRLERARINVLTGEDRPETTAAFRPSHPATSASSPAGLAPSTSMSSTCGGSILAGALRSMSQSCPIRYGADTGCECDPDGGSRRTFA
jgi:hypothetical protein